VRARPPPVCRWRTKWWSAAFASRSTAFLFCKRLLSSDSFP
jgi:hypothetical protein